MQMPPNAPPPSRLVLSPGSGRRCSCVLSSGLNEKNRPICLTFLAKVVSSCCQGRTSRPEQFLVSSRVCPTGQWGLSRCHRTHMSEWNLHVSADLQHGRRLHACFQSGATVSPQCEWDRGDAPTRAQCGNTFFCLLITEVCLVFMPSF